VVIENWNWKVRVLHYLANLKQRPSNRKKMKESNDCVCVCSNIRRKKDDIERWRSWTCLQTPCLQQEYEAWMNEEDYRGSVFFFLVHGEICILFIYIFKNSYRMWYFLGTFLKKCNLGHRSHDRNKFVLCYFLYF
jgi:hypothetical protein